MIHTFALNNELKLLQNLELTQLNSPEISWYWVDFEAPDENEIKELSDHFNFHKLAIEDCLHNLERPKVDYYEGYSFFVLHALNQETLTPEEVDIFAGKNYVVSFHKAQLQEIEQVRHRMINGEDILVEGHTYILYLIFDKIVDAYFPAVYRIEDYLGQIDIRANRKLVQSFMDSVFDIRDDLLKLRRIVNQMKELVYRILNSEHLRSIKENNAFYNDIHDHLLKMSDTIESNREITADMRDSFLSINSHRMNSIMTVLTVVTSIFTPLTFIVGVYGMNFNFMPELQWKYGYFGMLGFMSFIGISMLLWFKRKGWFDIYK